MKKTNQKQFIEGIALARINKLFKLADVEFEKNPKRSKKYIALALKIGTRNRVRIPQTLKKNFCKKCGAFLKQGKNSKIRIKNKLMNVTCLDCKTMKRVSVSKK